MGHTNIAGCVIVLYTITEPGGHVADEEQKKERKKRTKEERKNIFFIYIRYNEIKRK